MNRWLIALAAMAVFPASSCAQSDSTTALERARRLLDAAPVFDGHNDLAWRIREDPRRPRDVEAYDLSRDTPGQTDLRRLREGRVGAQFWSVYIPGEYADSGYARVQLEQIDIARRFIAKYPELELALTADEVERILNSGRIASLLGIEGGHAIENSLGALRVYYDLGVRYMTLTHNVTLDWADAAMDSARHGGLTDFGREVVREMNRLGMLIDLSHASDATMSDALDVSEAPVIFSHSSARRFSSHLRNVPDSILARLPANGGVVMVTFVPEFLSQAAADTSASWQRQVQRFQEELPDPARYRAAVREMRRTHAFPKTTVGDVADHIEHIRTVAGVDYIGLGGDYDGNSRFPVGMEDVSGYPLLFAELIRRGWTADELVKLANGNILRALRGAEAVARRLGDKLPPSTRTIDDTPEDIVRLSLLRHIRANGVARLRSAYDSLHAIYPAEAFREPLLNSLGYRELRSGDAQAALEIFKLNVELYPEAWNTHDSLGEAYMEADQLEMAVQSYERSLELNPDNSNAVSMLEKLRRELTGRR